ncbi:MAG TPA: peptidylprolyl isomerase [Stellaceae bacterium]|jgi:peptidyl-prolyl cis-trans isomerase SurA
MTVFRWLCVLFAAAMIAAGTSASAQAPHRNPARAPAGAPPSPEMQTQIAAVVNDQVISVYDLISRIRIVLLSSNLPDSAEGRQRIQKQVLHQLIDEKLELQEAKKQSVTASDSEIEAAIQLIEKQNNMKPGGLNAFLKAQNIDRGSLIDQITASIVWGKLVRRQAAESTEISDQEVDEAMRREKENANEPEARVAEIFLAVDTPAQEAEVRSTADRLIEEMRKGARFSAIAQQFSQSATAAVGGDLGWIRPDQLTPELAKTVSGMKVGELSQPIRTGAGYYVVLVLGRRTGTTGEGQSDDTVYDIVQVVLPVPPAASMVQKQAAAMTIIGIKNASHGCADFLRLGKEKGPQLTSEGHLRSSQISPQMHQLVDKLQPGQTSNPILEKNGVGMLMLCAKRTGGGGGPTAITRGSVMETIAKQRYDTVARRYLTDLRRAAYVDIRM